MKFVTYMKRNIRTAALAIPLLLSEAPMPAQEAASPAIAATPKIQIGPGDLIEVKIFDIPEMSQTVRVDDVGDATFHLIGRLHLAGLTVEESQGLIAERYVAGNFLVDPQVAVFIHEYSTQGVSVLGEVVKPGVYQALGRRSLIDILSEAGGLTSTANNLVTVERHTDGSVFNVKLSRDAEATLAVDVEVQPGDKVIVPRAGIVYVLGDVYRPGGFVMQNEGKITLLQAVAMAAGTQATAALSGAKLIRKSPSGYTETPVSLKKIMDGKSNDIQMQAEDILYVPNRALKSVLYRGLPGVLESTSSAAIYHAAF